MTVMYITGFVRVLLLLAGTWSKVVLVTLAVLVTLGAAGDVTTTVKVITALAAFAIGPALLHVTTAPAALQVQPAGAV